MGVYHGLQLVLAVGVAGLVAWRLRILCFVTAWDGQPLLADLRLDPARATTLVRRLDGIAPESYIARATGAALDSEKGSDVILSEIAYEASVGLDALRSLARVGTASGLLGMVGYLVWMIEGDHGLLGLQAGLPEKIAMERALLAVAIGAAVALFSHSSRASLRSVGEKSVQQARRAARAVVAGQASIDPDRPKDGREKPPMIRSRR